MSFTPMGVDRDGGYYIEVKDGNNPIFYVWKWTKDAFGNSELENVLEYQTKKSEAVFENIQSLYLVEDEGWGAVFNAGVSSPAYTGLYIFSYDAS
jgi:hypothetical protein